MTGWFKDNMSVVWSWAALMAAAAIVFGVTRGTPFAQLGIGLLTAAIALLVGMAVFELIWRAAVHWLDSTGGRPTAETSRRA
jgi:hypothetical protein